MKLTNMTKAIFLSMALLASANIQAEVIMPSINAPTTKNLAEPSPVQALQLLVQGNQRFLTGTRKMPNLLNQVAMTKDSQHPFAVILSCMDSRTSPELLFDQGIGDIFTIRVAGNVLNEDEIASLEYATKISGAKIIVIMGHTNCGAVKGACHSVQLGHLPTLLSKINPAISVTAKTWGGTYCDKPDFINAAAKQNVLLVANAIKQQSPVIQALMKEHKVEIVPAIYNLATGKVTFLR
jgi:carbonic anhydrase